ncbi:hypothetical protein ACJX0J_034214, partial [Zea mays]
QVEVSSGEDSVFSQGSGGGLLGRIGDNMLTIHNVASIPEGSHAREGIEGGRHGMRAPTTHTKNKKNISGPKGEKDYVRRIICNYYTMLWKKLGFKNKIADDKYSRNEDNTKQFVVAVIAAALKHYAPNINAKLHLQISLQTTLQGSTHIVFWAFRVQDSGIEFFAQR